MYEIENTKNLIDVLEMKKEGNRIKKFEELKA